MLTNQLLGRLVPRLMLASIQFASKLFIAVVSVYVRPLAIVCVHFFAIGCLAAKPDALELLCSVCRQVLCSVGPIADRAGAVTVLVGPVFHAAFAKYA